ncbi:MAG: TonB-dependent receptor [Rhodothermales bacterium]|nr:TonB-dependent receptor [Rhodothermales bacterium]MBO6778775.1 TonB-dependent receptor [Rhodothermales bacterium]
MKKLIALAGLVLTSLGAGAPALMAQANGEAVAAIAAEPRELGSVFGYIVDSEDGWPLIGVNVVIRGTTIGSSTDIDGRFEIEGLQQGDYDLEATYIGYNPLFVEGVEVEDGIATRLDLTMSAEALDLGEVVVEARAIQNNEANLLRVRAKAVQVSDAISAEAISRSGSGDAAAAMTKVTGASVVGGKYVYIRGLGDRYTNTTLNGSSLPSADPDRKAFQLDLFPSSLLEKIVTLKTFTPDKPGDFSGGLVDVATKTFPDAFTFSFSASSTYDSQASLVDNFLTYEGGASDWIGWDDGTRGLPETLEGKEPSAQLPSQQDLRDIRRGVTNEIRAARADSLNAFAQAFNTTMSPSTASAPLNTSLSTAVGGQATLFGRPLGYTGSLTYGRKYSYYNDGVFSRWQLAGGTVDQVDRLTSDTYFGANPDLDIIDRADPRDAANFANVQGSEETDWGGSGTLAFKPWLNSEVSLTALRTQSGHSQASLLSGFRDQNSTARFITRTLAFQERSLSTYQLRGEHAFAPLLVEWKASIGTNTQDEPDLRFFSSVENIQDNRTTFSLGGGNAPPPQRYFRNLREESQAAKLDLTAPVSVWSGLRAKVKVGGAYDNADRTFRQRRFEYMEGRAIDFSDFDGDETAYFSEGNFGVLDTLQVGGIVAYDAGLYLLENSPDIANYDANRAVTAGYAMVELPVTRKLRMIAGARLERTDVTSTSLDETLPDEIRVGRVAETDVLPSLNVVYEMMDGMNLRAAATRTLARPTFRELAPFQSFNFVGGDVQEGNPQLERTLITNYDLRWEWFMRPGELLAISGFYKEFTNPIETVLRTVGEGRFVSFQNVPEARVYGLEFEARRQLDAWTSNEFLGRFSLGGNVSLVNSHVDIPEEELVIIRASDASAEETRQLEGQSPVLANLSLNYENYETGTVVGLYYNVFGDRLATVTEGATPDVYEKSRADLDLTFSKNLPRNLRLKLGAKNLLGADHRRIQTFKDVEYDYMSYSRSRTLSLGLTYQID